MDAGALRGKNMKNVIRQRGFKRRQCPDRRKNTAYDSLLVASKNHAEGHRGWEDSDGGSRDHLARALEMFLKSLLTKTCLITQAKFSNVVSVAHMKQCIESEKLFHFLKDLAEAATSTATQMDNKGMSVWPIYRTKKNSSVPKPPGAGKIVPQRSLLPLERDSSSSESELYICL